MTVTVSSESSAALSVGAASAPAAQPQQSQGHDASALLPVYKRQPLTFVRGSGVELFDDAGRAYLDFASGIAVNALGYGDEGVRAAIQAAAEPGFLHVSNLYSTQPAERLAAWLAAHSFASKVFFCNSGAEANEGAFKFARRWARTQAESAVTLAGGSADSAAWAGGAKHEIIALRGSFHGRLFASLAATDRPGYRAPFRPLAGGVRIVERDLTEIAAAVDRETTAAVILEPVQGEGGVRVLDPGLVREIRALATERDALLIFDEVQCGLGRTGTLFAYERLGVEPDLLTLAKPLAGGLPMGAVLLADRVAAAVKYGDHATTFGGGPFVAAVALHVVERLADPALLAGVCENGGWLGGVLEGLTRRRGPVRAVRGAGYMWGVDVAESAGNVVERARELGLLVLTAGEHTVRLLPPLVATREELARGVALLEAALFGGAA